MATTADATAGDSAAMEGQGGHAARRHVKESLEPSEDYQKRLEERATTVGGLVVGGWKVEGES